MQSIRQQFDEAVAFVQSGKSDFQPDNALKLKMYALYKQATEGDVSGKRPGMLQLVDRAKWDAWAARKGLTQEAAMQEYVDCIAALRG